MRLPNGYGSVYKLSGNRRKPWRILAPADKFGNQKTIGYAKTKSEGLTMLSDYNQSKPQDSKPPLSEIFEIFMITKRHKAQKTQDMYYTTWNYFEDLEDEPIDTIKSRHIQDIVDNLLDEGKSYSSVHKVKVLASQLYKIAMQDDLISKNYAQFIILPDKPKPNNATFSEFEINKLFEFAKNNYWAKVMVVMIYTCMRPSELLNVTKFNVHLNENYIIAGGKTEAGTDRYIPIYYKIKPIIKQLMATKGSEYLVSMEGEKVRYRYYLDKHYEVIEELGLQKLTPHKCRKTGATEFQKMGMDMVTLQKIMGHEDFKTTEKYYIGDLTEALQKEMQQLAK
jgi:site-specific recombinase, phage integrase family